MTRQHENADHLMPGEGWALMDGTDMPDSKCEQLRCNDCGAWLPLGPSNDRGVPALELRLAESLATQGDDGDDSPTYHDYIIAYWVDQDAVEQAALAERARRSRRLRRDELIPVTREALDKTPLRLLSEWVIYRLCRDGRLPHVKVGRRRFLTADGIAEFMRSGGETGKVD